MNINLRDFPARDERAARQALNEHPRPGYVRGHVLLLVEHVQADPARLVAAATAARARHGELDREGEPPQRLRRYLVAAALAERGLATALRRLSNAELEALCDQFGVEA
jgi:hypothetical protein